MRENDRAADDVDAIRARLAELAAQRAVRRRGTAADHCGHCPTERGVNCAISCVDEARRQGWYLPELFP